MRIILAFINLILLKDTWKNHKIGTKLIIEPSRILLQSKNSSLISISKELQNKDNSLKIKWQNEKESHLRVIDDKTIVLYDNDKTELFKRKQNIINHLSFLYFLNMCQIGMTAYSFYLLLAFIDFVFRRSGSI
jgi:hypothetical protein